MDQLDFLKAEANSPHAIFHDFLLTLSKDKKTTQFFFFEGEEDPVFYFCQISHYLCDRDHHTFVCWGRDNVLKVHSLVNQTNQGVEQAHFFIDKDHTDIMSPGEVVAQGIFQTSNYSFENYLIDDKAIRRYWVERLHLTSTDPRLGPTISKFKAMYFIAMKKLRTLMAIILLGRGIEGRPPTKLNLNNVALDRIFLMDIDKEIVRWRRGALGIFLANCGMNRGKGTVSISDIKSVCRQHLPTGSEKRYVRGKYELWFFVKFLNRLTQQLCVKPTTTNAPRHASPKILISEANCVLQLSPLVSCPPELSAYLHDRLLHQTA